MGLDWETLSELLPDISKSSSKWPSVFQGIDLHIRSSSTNKLRAHFYNSSQNNLLYTVTDGPRWVIQYDLELKGTSKLEIPTSFIEKRLRCFATWITIEPFNKLSDPINLLWNIEILQVGHKPPVYFQNFSGFQFQSFLSQNKI